MSISFNPLKICLVYIEEKADQKFWEKSWKSENIKSDILSRRFDPLVTPITKKFLDPPAKILEGGCGKGEYVYLLKKAGFKSFGVDTAKETVKKINKAMPDLKIKFGDVRKLEFCNNFFDGYWSLGVIEHFYNGFDHIIKEAYRVIKPGGYFFLTFPYLSPLRKLKIKFNKYPIKSVDNEPKNFYQFALDKDLVIKKLFNYGFTPVFEKSVDGFKGFKDEMLPILKILNNVGVIRYIISLIFAPFAGHIILLVFKKIKF